MAVASRILSALRRMLRPSRAPQHPVPRHSAEPGRAGASATIAVRAPSARALVLQYAPVRDGAPDAGEIVWTWVPFEENDGRGKDRPVLVIARQSADRVYAVRLTSKPHDRDREFVALGSGAWDPEGRGSWVDLEQIYSVHARGMRREAAALDAERFQRVADALRARYGWRNSRRR
jgi:mRNA-degrading endonuclease toxin of MazEF toxin-antitoxin module